MNKYELAVVVSAKIEDDARTAVIEKVKRTIEKHGGQITNIITEKDTVNWFSQDENFVVPYFSDYKSPLLSIRLGCRDGYCFASLPITESEFCYDHSL